MTCLHSLSQLPLSLLRCHLNLFRITCGAKCQNTPVTFSTLHSSSGARPETPLCKPSRHRARPPSPENHSRLRPPKAPFPRKDVFPCTQIIRGASSQELIFRRDHICICSGIPKSHFSLTSGDLHGQIDGRAGWWKSSLPIHILPERVCLLRQLILRCFRGHVSLLVHHFLVSHVTFTHTHTPVENNVCRDGLVVMELAMRDEPKGGFHP